MTKPTVEDVLILEAENAFGAQLHRPPIIDLVYAKVLAEWKESLTEVEVSRLRFLKLILEVEAQALKVQSDVIISTVQHSIVKRWGKLKFPDWDNLSADQQATKIFILCREKGILKKIRDKFDTEGKLISGQHLYDIPDLAKFESEVRSIILEAILADIHKLESEKPV